MADQVLRVIDPTTTASVNNKVIKKRTHDALRTREYLRPEELSSLFKTIRKRSRNALRDELVVRLLFTHALRVSELCALTWDRIDLTNAEVQVRRAKSGRYAIHALKGRELTLLRRYWRHCESPPGHIPLFLSEQGTRLHPNTVNHIVRVNGDRAGLPDEIRPLHAHMLRHSCGYFLRQSAGKDLAFIADRLGHRNLASTRIYTAVDAIRDDDVDFEV